MNSPVPSADRMFASLPDVFRASDDSGDLARLLAVFEELFFGDPDRRDPRLPGIERSVQAIPALFAPLGDGTASSLRTPAPFLHWLASWLAFTPHALFSSAALRRIVAGIVPLYGLRGTRDYLVRLIELCFDDVRSVHVDDRPHVGFTIGSAVIGSGTLLAQGRAWSFKVVVDLAHAAERGADQEPQASLLRRLRAVIDFAKPAHTVYDLVVNPGAPVEPDEFPDSHGR